MSKKILLGLFVLILVFTFSFGIGVKKVEAWWWLIFHFHMEAEHCGSVAVLPGTDCATINTDNEGKGWMGLEAYRRVTGDDTTYFYNYRYVKPAPDIPEEASNAIAGLLSKAANKENLLRLFKLMADNKVKFEDIQAVTYVGPDYVYSSPKPDWENQKQPKSYFLRVNQIQPGEVIGDAMARKGMPREVIIDVNNAMKAAGIKCPPGMEKVNGCATVLY